MPPGYSRELMKEQRSTHKISSRETSTRTPVLPRFVTGKECFGRVLTHLLELYFDVMHCFVNNYLLFHCCLASNLSVCIFDNFKSVSAPSWCVLASTITDPYIIRIVHSPCWVNGQISRLAPLVYFFSSLFGIYANPNVKQYRVQEDSLTVCFCCGSYGRR